jgi:hypothetical protein
LGLPFPTVLRRAREGELGAFWGLNGLGAVAGSALALAAAPAWGVTAVGWAAAAAYLLTAAVCRKLL